MKLLLRTLLLFFAITLAAVAPAQISQGGYPLSFDQQDTSLAITLHLSPPDLRTILREDQESEKLGMPQRVAITVPVKKTSENSGRWETLPDGSYVWMLRLECDGAEAMNVCFDDFHLPEGARLFLYNDDRTHLIGAFTSLNNTPSRHFATELVPGDAVTLHLETPSRRSGELALSMSEVSYYYQHFYDDGESRGSSDYCEVNINCPEGENYQKHKRGVVRIYVKQGSAYFWCTGSLLNNTRLDRTPFLLTADHCAPNASAADFQQWVFYFNFEAPGCDNPPANPTPSSMVGATLLSSADVSGSDFMLVLLNEDVPESFSPFYMGWDAQDNPGEEGVTIHHPSGDIKKISTYTEPVDSWQWGGTPNTHWRVFWTETESGWGVTEGGSSGAPLLDENGVIIGTLTGGLAACDPGGGGPGTGPDKPDYYGKFSYSWDQNGVTPETRLKDWLDPDNTGTTFLPGMNSTLTADFITEDRLTLAGGSITFMDLSSGPPVTWEWYFEGGKPETYAGKTPPEVSYARAGKYAVRLIVSDGLLSDTLTRAGYIEVVGHIYPNPTVGPVNIYLGEETPETLTVEVYNTLGRLIFEEKITGNTSRKASTDLSGFSSGIYIIRIQVGQFYLFSKVMLIQE